MHQDTNTQKPIHIAGHEQLPVASVVRGSGGQFTSTHGERGKVSYSILKGVNAVTSISRKYNALVVLNIRSISSKR